VPDNKVRHQQKVIISGAEVRNVKTLADLTALGLDQPRGVLIVSIPAQSTLSQYGFTNDDVILSINGQKVTEANLANVLASLKATGNSAEIWRGQNDAQLEFDR